MLGNTLDGCGAFDNINWGRVGLSAAAGGLTAGGLGVLAGSLRGSSAIANAASIGRAANTARGVRYVANSAGEIVPYVRGGTLEVSEHAALALTRRNVSVRALDDLVSNTQGFRYWHDGTWKTGYYDSTSRLFAGTAENRVATVIQGGRVSGNYINNLRAARP